MTATTRTSKPIPVQQQLAQLDELPDLSRNGACVYPHIRWSSLSSTWLQQQTRKKSHTGVFANRGAEWRNVLHGNAYGPVSSLWSRATWVNPASCPKWVGFGLPTRAQQGKPAMQGHEDAFGGAPAERRPIPTGARDKLGRAHAPMSRLRWSNTCCRWDSCPMWVEIDPAVVTFRGDTQLTWIQPSSTAGRRRTPRAVNGAHSRRQQ